MNPVLIDAVIAAGSVGLFGSAYAGARVATRPARVPAAPATPELGAEPPAVVSLLANRWRLTDDASESTLLDLAARGHMELRQPGNEPRHTTIHLPTNPPSEQLAPHEQRVLHRVRELAVDGVVPITALTFRNEHQARRWNRRLHQEVIEDARTRGLSQRRFSAALVSGLSAVAAVTGAGLGIVVLRASLRDGEIEVIGAIWTAVIAFGVLSGFAGRPHGERDTAAGRAAGGRWSGVRAWLRAHEEFANLPPAAVAVWDRYLPYGAALGVTRLASQILDLGLGDRRLVWSSCGGSWRRVRVRYPRLWYRYGQSVPRLLARGGVPALLGAAVLYYLGPPPLAFDPPEPSGDSEVALITWMFPLSAALLLGYGCYLLLRTILDLMTTRDIVGEVLWREVWRSHQRKNSSPVPWLDYLAVDDGHADRTVAWGLPRALAAGVLDRDVVRIRVRPWSRRITALTVLQPGRTHSLTDVSAPPESSRDVAGTLLSALKGAATLSGSISATQLLTAEEVGQALGVLVREPEPMPVPGPLSSAMFATTERGRQVLMAGIASGRYGDWVWRRAAKKGTAVAGIGDAAVVDGDQGAVRVGDAVVVLTLLGAGRARREQLPWLLHQAAPRLPRQREPV